MGIYVILIGVDVVADAIPNDPVEGRDEVLNGTVVGLDEGCDDGIVDNDGRVEGSDDGFV